VGNLSLHRGAKRPGRGVEHPHSSSAEVKKEMDIYVCYPSGPSWALLGKMFIGHIFNNHKIFHIYVFIN
jgi:hypothetical protein